MWRRYNIGAGSPEELGDYFSWGNVEGHPEGSGYNFSQDVYDATPGGSIGTNLSLDQDAAHVILGENWRMPTADEFQELYDNCTSVWTTLNGVNGRLFTSLVNGATIFFPATGYYDGALPTAKTTYGLYWSSTFNSATKAFIMYFNNSNVNPKYTGTRHNGFTIRAVKEPTRDGGDDT